MSVLLIAAVSSLVIGGVLALFVFVVWRATKAIVRHVRDPLRRQAVTERWIGDASLSGPRDESVALSVRRTGWLAGWLIAAALLGLVGMFLPLYQLHVPGQRSFSTSQFRSTPYGAITLWLDLALLLALAYFAVRRRDRIVAAIVVGYCALELGALVVVVASFTLRGAHFESGYYVLGVSYAAQVVAFAIAFSVLVAGRSHRGLVTVRTVGLGVAAAVLGAAASPLFPLKAPGMSIWVWKDLPWQEMIGLVTGLLVVVLIPLVALRIADRAGAGMALGLAAGQALSVALTLLQKMAEPRFNQLTFGFWLTMFGVVTLVLLAFALTKPFVQRPESTPIPVPVT